MASITICESLNWWRMLWFKGSFTVYQFCFNKNINLPVFVIMKDFRLQVLSYLFSTNKYWIGSFMCNTFSWWYAYIHWYKRIQQARESVLEFLLINHPLDCLFAIKEVNVICRIFLWHLVQIEVVSMSLKSALWTI